MRASYLRYPIDIYSLTTTKTAFGTIEENYELSYSTRANVLFNSEDRVVSEGEVYYPTSRTFIVRHYVPVNEYCHIKWKGKEYRIISINKNDVYNNIEIIATELND